VVSGIVSRFHPSIDVVAASDLPFMDMRRVAQGLQLLGNPKRPVAIAARVADEDIGHALSLSTLVIVQRFGGDIFGPRSGRFNPAAPLGEAGLVSCQNGPPILSRRSHIGRAFLAKMTISGHFPIISRFARLFSRFGPKKFPVPPPREFSSKPLILRRFFEPKRCLCGEIPIFSR
jgi:hypothetical protein